MDDFEWTAAEELVRSALGARISLRRHDPTLNTPMSFFLKAAEQHVGAEFLVFWASNAPPEVLCLRGEPKSLVVFNERYLELVGFVRHLFVGKAFETLRIEIAERTCLKVIAELALRYGDPEFAVLAFLKSMVGKGIYIFDTNTLLDLEQPPYDEAYMATWFYGLAHELGHVAARPQEDFLRSGLFSDANILDAVQIALDSLPYPDVLKQKVLTAATTHRSDSVVGIDNLRCGGLADLSAAHLLLTSTHSIMHATKSGPFRIQNFIAEMMIFLNIIVLIQQCRQVARIASQSSVYRALAHDLVRSSFSDLAQSSDSME